MNEQRRWDYQVAFQPNIFNYLYGAWKYGMVLAAGLVIGSALTHRGPIEATHLVECRMSGYRVMHGQPDQEWVPGSWQAVRP